MISNKRRDAAVASSVSGGGSSGLTFESFSAAKVQKDEGEGEGLAAVATGEGAEASTPSLAAMEEGTPWAAAAEGLAAAQDRAATVASAAADAAQAAGGAVEDAAAAGVGGEEGSVLGENAAAAAAEEALQGVANEGDVGVEMVESVVAKEAGGEGEAGAGVEVMEELMEDVVSVEQDGVEAAAATERHDEGV